MKRDEITAAMSGQSSTNGWDAVCAYSAGRANQIFFQQYLTNGPTHPDRPLRAIVDTQENLFYLIDVKLGPPEISFPTDLNIEQCQVQMFLLSGSFVKFDAENQIVKSVVTVQPNQSWLTGAVNLAKVSGDVNTLGKVAVDLGSGAYQPTISGIDPASVLSTQIGEAVLNYFQNNAVTYPLGVIALSNVPASLQPTNFEIATQPALDNTSGDGCVLVLIQTNGSKGNFGQLATYPIPTGYEVGLIVSSQIIFNQLMPVELTTEFQSIGAQFSGQQSNGGWQTVSSGGTLNLGVLGEQSGHNPYSSDSSQNLEPVQVSAGNLSVSPAGESLRISWGQTWDQYWTYWFGISDGNGGVIWDSDASDTMLSGSYSMSATPSVDPVTDIVSFGGSGSAGLSPTNPPDWFLKYVEPKWQVESQFNSTLKSNFDCLFSGLRVPSVDVFALSNLLFPSRHDAISLREASVPSDLLANGYVVSALSIAPPSINVGPVGQQQFSAFFGGNPTTDVTWECQPRVGSIDASGLYTAPFEFGEPTVIIVTAINNNDSKVTSSAMVLLSEPPAATELVVSPTEVFVTTGNTFYFLITDSKGNPVDVTCTIDPNIGQIVEGFSTGQWLYLAPQTLDSPVTVTVEAVSDNDSSLTGRATVQLVNTETVAITPANVSLEVGATQVFEATTSTLNELCWVVYPTGAGTIKGSGLSATYTAPATVVTQQLVMIAAYGVESTAGVGIARITLLKS